MTKIVAFSGSLRKESYNTQALKLLAGLIKDVEVEILDLNDYPMPGYNQDIESAGMPEVVEKFKAKIAEATAILIASPEYNHSVPGVLKNILDWASRGSVDLKDVFENKMVGLITVSGGSFGGVRSQIAWLPIFQELGLTLYPNLLTVPSGGQAFDQNGQIINPKMQERFTQFAQDFSSFVQKYSS